MVGGGFLGARKLDLDLDRDLTVEEREGLVCWVVAGGRPNLFLVRRTVPVVEGRSKVGVDDPSEGNRLFRGGVDM